MVLLKLAPILDGVPWLHETQPTIWYTVYPELEFPHRTGRYLPGGYPFSSLGFVGVVDIRGACVIRGWDRVLHGCRWPHEPQRISNGTLWVGFQHRAGRYRPGGVTVFVPGALKL